MGNWNKDKTEYIATADEIKKFKEAIPNESPDPGTITTKFVCAYCGEHISGGALNLNVAFENGAHGKYAYLWSKPRIT